MKREVTDVFIQMSNGNFTTRINPINRYSKIGFAIRRMNKLNRTSKFGVSAQHVPYFLTNKQIMMHNEPQEPSKLQIIVNLFILGLACFGIYYSLTLFL